MADETKTLKLLLAEDDVLVTAAQRVVDGAHSVAQVFAGLFRKAQREGSAWHAELAELNGEPALLAYHRGYLDTVFVLSVDGGRIESIRAVRNPEKLAWLKRQFRDPHRRAPAANTPPPTAH